MNGQLKAERPDPTMSAGKSASTWCFADASRRRDRVAGRGRPSATIRNVLKGRVRASPVGARTRSA